MRKTLTSDHVNFKENQTTNQKQNAEINSKIQNSNKDTSEQRVIYKIKRLIPDEKNQNQIQIQQKDEKYQQQVNEKENIDINSQIPQINFVDSKFKSEKNSKISSSLKDKNDFQGKDFQFVDSQNQIKNGQFKLCAPILPSTLIPFKIQNQSQNNQNQNSQSNESQKTKENPNVENLSKNLSKVNLQIQPQDMSKQQKEFVKIIQESKKRSILFKGLQKPDFMVQPDFIAVKEHLKENNIQISKQKSEEKEENEKQKFDENQDQQLILQNPLSSSKALRQIREKNSRKSLGFFGISENDQDQNGLFDQSKINDDFQLVESSAIQSQTKRELQEFDRKKQDNIKKLKESQELKNQQNIQNFNPFTIQKNQEDQSTQKIIVNEKSSEKIVKNNPFGNSNFNFNFNNKFQQAQINEIPKNIIKQDFSQKQFNFGSQNIFKTMNVQQNAKETEESEEEGDEDPETDKDPRQILENPKADSQKLFQQYIEELKHLKIYPDTIRENGIISIEKINQQLQSPQNYFLVYRNYAGAVIFKGIILPKVCKVKICQKQSQTAQQNQPKQSFNAFKQTGQFQFGGFNFSNQSQNQQQVQNKSEEKKEQEGQILYKYVKVRVAIFLDKEKEGENGEILKEKKLDFEDLEIKFVDQNHCDLFVQVFQKLI